MGQGKVYTKSSDLPYNYLVHAVYNASRVVSSLVIEGLRYGSNPLLEMRIQDILREVDLSRHDPNHPDDPPPSGDPEEGTDFDGTEQGLSPRTQADVDTHLSDAAENIDFYWTGPWPLLHIFVISLTLFHMAVDLLGNTVLYDSDAMGLNEEDFHNARQFGFFAFEISVWTLALTVACAIAEKIPTGWGEIAVVVGVMAITLGLAWWHAHLLVDNGITNAGAMSWFFLVLSASYFCMAAGYIKTGGIAAWMIFGFLGWLMGKSIDEIKALIQFTVWSRIVFAIMALVFFIYALHFYNY